MPSAVISGYSFTKYLNFRHCHFSDSKLLTLGHIWFDCKTINQTKTIGKFLAKYSNQALTRIDYSWVGWPDTSKAAGAKRTEF